MKRNAVKCVIYALLPVLITSCTTFHLSEHQGSVAVKKQRRAKDVLCVVRPFAYTGEDAMTPSDLKRWQEILAEGLNHSNIFAEVLAQAGDQQPLDAAYVIEGKVTKFSFQKNWVPTFFPVHLGLSFLTLTIYTWVAGPTTVTIVEFESVVDLKDAKTGSLIKSFTPSFKDTSTLNVYSKDVNNPYGNPSLVFAPIIDSLASDIAATLPE